VPCIPVEPLELFHGRSLLGRGGDCPEKAAWEPKTNRKTETVFVQVGSIRTFLHPVTGDQWLCSCTHLWYSFVDSRCSAASCTKWHRRSFTEHLWPAVVADQLDAEPQLPGLRCCLAQLCTIPVPTMARLSTQHALVIAQLERSGS
jgi:hypothetical protein